jgi:hypothetical protein
VNANPLSAAEAAKAVDWFDDAGSERISGSLVRVECLGKQIRLNVKNDDGKTITFLVPDTRQFEIRGGDALICGVQKPRRVTVSYKPSTKKQDSAKADAGEATGMEFHQ